MWSSSVFSFVHIFCLIKVSKQWSDKRVSILIIGSACI